jgi:ribosome-associated protein
LPLENPGSQKTNPPHFLLLNPTLTPTGTPRRKDQKPTTADETRALVDAVVEAIQEKKGTQIAVFDLKKLDSPIADFFIFASGRSDTQNSAIADEVLKHTKEKLKQRPNHVEGAQLGEWVLLDYIDVVVHIMLPRIREYYNLEEMWADADVHHVPDVA